MRPGALVRWRYATGESESVGIVLETGLFWSMPVENEDGLLIGSIATHDGVKVMIDDSVKLAHYSDFEICE